MCEFSIVAHERGSYSSSLRPHISAVRWPAQTHFAAIAGQRGGSVETSADANAILASNTRKELILQFVRDVGGADLSKGWQEGFDRNAKAQLPALQERIEKLKGWMADMKTGQRLTFAAKPGAGIEVNVNGTVKGIVEGDDFATAFLSIWLDAVPPNPGLKAGLLGGACG